MGESEKEEYFEILENIGEADDENIDLAQGAISLAALACPGIKTERYYHHLNKIAQQVTERHKALLKEGAADDAATRLAALKHIIVDQHGYEGDSESYDDLQNVNLKVPIGTFTCVTGVSGSGKSTLLESLKPALESRGHQLAHYALHQGQRQLPMKWSDNLLQHATQVVVDGFEQLSKLSQYRLKRYCRKFDKGLLITTHQPLGFADLTHLQPDLATALRVVAHLQRNHPEIIQEDDVRRHYRHHSHNLREMLFCLYDLFEKRRLETGAPADSV